MFILLLSLITAASPQKCYSLKDVLDEGCRAACVKTGRGEAGETDKAKICWCKTGNHYEDFIHNKVSLRGVRGTVESSPVIDDMEADK